MSSLINSTLAGLPRTGVPWVCASGLKKSEGGASFAVFQAMWVQPPLLGWAQGVLWINYTGGSLCLRKLEWFDGVTYANGTLKTSPTKYK